MTDDDRLTAEERQTLAEAHEMIRELRRTFFDPPPGSDRSLIEDLRMIVTLVNRASWVGKLILWGLSTLAGALMALHQIREFFAR